MFKGKFKYLILLIPVLVLAIFYSTPQFSAYFNFAGDFNYVLKLRNCHAELVSASKNSLKIKIPKQVRNDKWTILFILRNFSYVVQTQCSSIFLHDNLSRFFNHHGRITILKTKDRRQRKKYSAGFFKNINPRSKSLLKKHSYLFQSENNNSYLIDLTNHSCLLC